MHTRRDLGSVMMRAAAALLILTLMTSWFVTGHYARYATGASASDSARVAKFEIQETNLENSITLAARIKPGETLTKTIAVQNKSEVAVSYIVTIRNTTKNLPLTLTVGSDDHTAEMNSAAGYSFTAALPANSEATSLAFMLGWPVSPEGNTDPVRSGMVDEIRITVTAIQVD